MMPRKRYKTIAALAALLVVCAVSVAAKDPKIESVATTDVGDHSNQGQVFWGIPQPLLFPLASAITAVAILGAAIISSVAIIRSARKSAEAIRAAALSTSSSSVTAARVTAESARETLFEIERAQEYQARRSFALALRGEMKATLKLAERHSYREIYENVLNQLRLNQMTAMPRITIRDDPQRSVFYLNSEKIGLLPEPLPETLSMVYTLTNSLAIDMNDMARGGHDHPTIQMREEFLGHFLETYDEAKELAESVVDNLTEVINR